MKQYFFSLCVCVCVYVFWPVFKGLRRLLATLPQKEVKGKLILFSSVLYSVCMNLNSCICYTSPVAEMFMSVNLFSLERFNLNVLNDRPIVVLCITVKLTKRRPTAVSRQRVPYCVLYLLSRSNQDVQTLQDPV